MRQAQVNLLKNPRNRHPYFWAPYILIGNWQ
ncbi:MAG: CHAT domain-containing protein [Scytonema sp. CRU_2_7]|nr:CHAT domain-containing protein [Scytonema sp. CRU_2_7]